MSHEAVGRAAPSAQLDSNFASSLTEVRSMLRMAQDRAERLAEDVRDRDAYRAEVEVLQRRLSDAVACIDRNLSRRRPQ